MLPTSCAEKVRELGENVAPAGCFPVPVRSIAVGDGVELFVNETSAALSPEADGVKITEIMQVVCC